MTTKKQQKKRIINVISYYRLLKNKDKGLLKVCIMEKCDFSESTFQYRIRNANFNRLELIAVEEIISKFKLNGLA